MKNLFTFCICAFSISILQGQCEGNVIDVRFSLPVNDVCLGEAIEVINETNEYGISNIVYTWYWGNGSQSPQRTRSDTFYIYRLDEETICDDQGNAGTFLLRLEAVSLDCPQDTFSATKPVFVNLASETSFDAPDFSCEENLRVSFNYPHCLVDPNTSFLWQFGDPNSGQNDKSSLQNPIHQFSEPGTYLVTLTIDNFCTTASFSKEVRVAGSRSPQANPDQFMMAYNKGEVLDVLANDELFSMGSVEMSIQSPPSNGTAMLSPDYTISYTPSPHFSGIDQFVYQICNPDCPSSCSVATVTISIPELSINEMFIPDTFTPNGDLINDTFVIPGLRDHPTKYEDSELVVIDRCGVLVFRANPYNEPWDGTDLKGENVPTGTYLYRWRTKDMGQREGEITLIR